MDITKAESYLYGRLKMLSNEKIHLVTKLNKIKIEIEETDNKISSMKENVDKAFEIFSPRTKKNDFAKVEIEKLEKHKGELELLYEDLSVKLEDVEEDINQINEALGEEIVVEENNVSEKTEKLSKELYGIHILESQEAERKRIARDLHDSIVQVLTNLVHKCEICMKIVDVDTIRTKLELEIMAKTLRDAIGEMRNIIYDLRPMSFDDLGLDITLERAVKSIDAETDMDVSLTIEGEMRDIPGIVQLTIFRIIQECACNSIKYSKGEKLNIRVVYDEQSVVLEITDDGVGFDYGEKASSNDNEHTGLGLNIMKERVALLSGTIDIKTEIGKGTVTTVSIPV